MSMHTSSEQSQLSPEPAGNSPNTPRPGSNQGHSRPTASVSHVTAGLSQISEMSSDAVQTPISQNQPVGESQQHANNRAVKKAKRKIRNRNRRNRTHSFIASEDSVPIVSELSAGLGRTNPDQMKERVPYYRGRNLSNTSLESAALLDHR